MSQDFRSQLLNFTNNTVGQFLYKRAGLVQVPQKSSMMSINGHKIWYQETGIGRPILFLHGLGANSLSWLFTLPSLVGQRRAIVLDLIGHGRSDKPLISYKISDFVDYVETFLDNLGLKTVELVGNSLGGWIGAMLAAKRPDLIERLVLVGSAGLVPSEAMQAKLLTVPFAPSNMQDTKTMLSLCFYDKVRYANQVSVFVSYMLRRLESSQETVKRVVASAQDPNEWLDNKLDQIKAPTLLLWGREDELMPIDLMERFSQGLRNSKIEVIDKCGHVPQIEQPKEFNRILTNFLFN